jgi:hypothetical protein
MPADADPVMGVRLVEVPWLLLRSHLERPDGSFAADAVVRRDDVNVIDQAVSYVPIYCDRAGAIEAIRSFGEETGRGLTASRVGSFDKFVQVLVGLEAAGVRQVVFDPPARAGILRLVEIGHAIEVLRNRSG